jgi:catechol 2,3-dioxygenase-like lactoylglutathione lyase family enzyme
MRLNHVSIAVSDLERSAVFYGEHLGLDRRIHEESGFLMLADENGSLLALTSGETQPNTTSFHFGFELADRGEVASARERLRAAGVDVHEWDDRGHWARLQIADPDGYRIDLFG